MDFLNDFMGGEEEGREKRGGKRRGGKRKGGKRRRREEYRDFAERYDRGAPYDHVSDEEAVERYREVSPHLSEEEYRVSAREALSRMSPEERVRFGQQLRGYAHQSGHGDFVDRDHDGQDDRFQDPDYLAGMMGRMHREQPDMLGALMGGLMGGGTNSGMAGAALGSLMGGRSSGGGGMMSNPVARAAMAGIAAMAVKRMMGNR